MSSINETNYDEYNKDFSSCREDIRYFIKKHVHYGWYPQVELTEIQNIILDKLLFANSGSITTIDGQPQVNKWPIAAWLLQQLVLLPTPKRIAIVASTKR